jgi:hypothetical protein
MLAVVRDVHEGGKDKIPGWRLMAHAKNALAKGGPDGLKEYYERCLDMTNPKGRRVKDTLEKHGRKTLESEHQRFMAAYKADSN